MGKRVVAVLIVAGVLVSAGVVWSAGTFLTKPVPMQLNAVPPGAVDVEFMSKSGSLISGWLFESESTRAAALLMHGLRSNRQQMVRRAEHLVELGITSLVFDFQAHGESPGSMITLGYLESLDAQAALEFLKSVEPALPVLVIGVSMGGAAAILASPSLDVQAMVLESVYPDVSTAIANRLAARIPGGQLFTSLLSYQIKPRIGIRASALAPVVKASRVMAATLVLSGGEDRHTTVDDTLALYQALPDPKAMALMTGAGHVDLEQFDPVRYWEVVEPFIQKHLVGGV